MADNLLMPEGSDPNYYSQWMPSQSLSAYQPTWRDKLGAWLMGDERTSPERNRLMEGLVGSRGLGETGPSAIDFTPAGIPLGVNDAWHKGDDRALAMALIPGAPKGVAAEARAATKGITAYHGSPHDFDRFDMSKIGTGEGAQAYGPGLYFAENEGVAKSYKDGLSKWNPQIDGKPIIEMWADGSLHHKIAEMTGLPPLDARSAGNWVAEAVRSGQPLRQVLDDKITAARHIYPAEMAEQEAARINAIGEKIAPIAPETYSGKMYEVRINADPSDFLDWDKPLSAQSEKVRGAVDAAMSSIGDRSKPTDIGSDVLADLIAKARGDASRPEFARTTLRDAGIPGIKYLDAGSRSAGEGSRNYVVFDQDIISIVRKYGIAAAASMYGMDAVNNAMGASQD